MNNKGQLGLNIVKSVMITLLVLAVIGVSIIIALPELRDVSDDIDLVTGSLVNESISNLSTAGADTTLADERNIALSSIVVHNASDGTKVVPATNYSVTGGTITGTSGSYIGTPVNITANYRYTSNRVTSIVGNVTDANTSFFSNSSTILAILVVVVIILAISIIIGVVSRFGVGRKSESSSEGTLMGV